MASSVTASGAAVVALLVMLGAAATADLGSDGGALDSLLYRLTRLYRYDGAAGELQPEDGRTRGGEWHDARPPPSTHKRQFRMQSECRTDGGCGAGRCCVPAVGSVHECRPLQARGAPCHPATHGKPFLGVRGFPLCPCHHHLACNPLTWKCEPQPALQPPTAVI